MKDQTQTEWLVFRDNPGTGILLSSDNVKSYTEHIDYATCADNAEATESIAFKWVPQQIAGLNQIMAASCGAQRCAQTCVNFGCLCSPASQTCI